MKLLDLKCPECGAEAIGAADWTPGLVEFTLEPDGTFIDYSGNTEMFWDGQDNNAPPGFMEVQCSGGHTWLTRLEYDDCEHKEAKYNTPAGTGWCPHCGCLYSVATGWRLPELPDGPTSWPALLTQRIEQAIAQLVRDGNVSLAASFAAQAAAGYYGDMVRETKRPNLVVVTVEGGCVQSVSAERPDDVRVVGVDFDVDGWGSDHPGVFTLEREEDGEKITERAGVDIHRVHDLPPVIRRWVDASDALAAAST